MEAEEETEEISWLRVRMQPTSPVADLSCLRRDASGSSRVYTKFRNRLAPGHQGDLFRSVRQHSCWCKPTRNLLQRCSKAALLAWRFMAQNI
ncbi:hypothetical protein PAHAL_9G442400 [Panicum hallii]|uniref:Uncharacterized protein n=1 Tax=Panicum hallii TaxID=206008 RepID=A0A2T8I4L7_9POAL|nr:hypothetical protein PAHAL_9G442400 [Panicum hallii]